MPKNLTEIQNRIYILFNIFLTLALFIGLYNFGKIINFNVSEAASAQEYFSAMTTNKAVVEHLLLSLCEIVAAGAILTKFFKDEEE